MKVSWRVVLAASPDVEKPIEYNVCFEALVGRDDAATVTEGQ